ncbi:hypothetical protein TRVL_09382 [Trypanosoma vivax]|nr:hypothetical protein TRVL_09382 [Trypanosoma vivax]
MRRGAGFSGERKGCRARNLASSIWFVVVFCVFRKGKRRPIALKGDRFGDLGKGTRSLSRWRPKRAIGLRSEFLYLGCEALSLRKAATKGARGFRFSTEAKCAGRRSERAAANFPYTSPIGERAVVGRAFRRSFCVPRFVPRSAEVLFGCPLAPRENFENPIFPFREKKEKRKEQQEKGQRASNK